MEKPRKTKFKQWILDKGLKNTRVARDLKVCQTSLSNVVCGKLFPEDYLIDRIIEYTRGEITAWDLLDAYTEETTREIKEASEHIKRRYGI